MWHKAMVVLGVCFVLGGSALSTSAFALDGSLGAGHRVSGRDAFQRDGVGNFHRGLRHSNIRVGRGLRHKWDPWGHWGAYYGPMITIP
jgi:hypothetical protein